MQARGDGTRYKISWGILVLSLTEVVVALFTGHNIQRRASHPLLEALRVILVIWMYPALSPQGRKTCRPISGSHMQSMLVFLLNPSRQDRSHGGY